MSDAYAEWSRFQWADALYVAPSNVRYWINNEVKKVNPKAIFHIAHSGITGRCGKEEKRESLNYSYTYTRIVTFPTQNVFRPKS